MSIFDRMPDEVRRTIEARMMVDNRQFPDENWWHLEKIERAEKIMVKDCPYCRKNLAATKKKGQSHVWLRAWDVMGPKDVTNWMKAFK